MGKYIFRLESDGESWFYFNDKLYIEKIKRDIDWDGDGTSTFVFMQNSQTLWMDSNKFYRIRIKYIHYANWSYNDPSRSYLHLKWAMEVIEKDKNPNNINIRINKFGPGRFMPGGIISSSSTSVT